ncbi:hypothetical protein EV126DRAFT_87953 [Verticillium dahliae]|nr:hypothetical protein EV126DRAFT_87953 [Verticillium dahliae]
MQRQHTAGSLRHSLDPPRRSSCQPRLGNRSTWCLVSASASLSWHCIAWHDRLRRLPLNLYPATTDLHLSRSDRTPRPLSQSASSTRLATMPTHPSTLRDPAHPSLPPNQYQPACAIRRGPANNAGLHASKCVSPRRSSSDRPCPATLFGLRQADFLIEAWLSQHTMSFTTLGYPRPSPSTTLSPGSPAPFSSHPLRESS